MPTLDTLSLEDFIPLIGQEFELPIENGEAYPLLLETALSLSETAAQVSPDRRIPFALHFRNPRRDAYLPQRTYSLKHETAGIFEIFIVPLGPDGQGMRYEAIFS